jgi:glucan phosphoethanolaminetransferase (alkaline phosphatase superfamily)
LIGEEYGFSINQFIIALSEKQHILDALQTYFISIFISILVIGTLFLLLFKVRTDIKRRFFIMPIVMLPISYIGAYKVYDKSAYSAFDYPSFVKVPMYIFTTYSKGWANISYRKKDNILIIPKNSPKYKHILWIVDESVRADYLSINGFKMNTTPFLKNYKDVISLGISSSTANNSAPSNYTMRNGIQLNQLPDIKYKTLSQSSIFQYAKKANYKAYCLDSQVEYKQMQNFMSLYDTKDMEEYWTLKNRNNSTMFDRYLINKISDIVDQNESTFMYIVKHGSHVPWITNYPKDKTIFRPVLGQFESVNFDNRDKAINTYANSIRWGVDDFFKELLSKINLDNTIIFYTSDHGINIAENNMLLHYGLAKNPPSSMATVPILIFTKNIRSKYNFIKDAYSNYQIFPSILNVMGYDNNVTSKYNKTLFDGGIKNRKFFSGYIFGKGFVNEF